MLFPNFYYMFHGHFGKTLKDFKFEIKNLGDKLQITASGTKENVTKLEAKINAMKTLCCDGEGCCGK